jgi:hypothetical protein
MIGVIGPLLIGTVRVRIRLINQFRRFMKKYWVGLIVFFSIVLQIPEILASSELITPNFKISIVRNCEEGNVSCDDVTYIGVNKKTGASIKLKGKTYHKNCSDGVTPCRFLGYVFENGNTKYYIENNTLYVIQNGETILEEVGEWKNN